MEKRLFASAAQRFISEKPNRGASQSGTRHSLLARARSTRTRFVPPGRSLDTTRAPAIVCCPNFVSPLSYEKCRFFAGSSSSFVADSEAGRPAGGDAYCFFAEQGERNLKRFLQDTQIGSPCRRCRCCLARNA